LGASKAVPLKEGYEKQFLDFLNLDRVLNIFTICDIKYQRDKTRIWVVIENEEILGYLLEFDKRIVHTHGRA